ncbi:hypothetical protein Godav_025487, partial [Gossypium davidsonii]|nr:hypothetical protein [Gossypium davidsonii]
IQQSKTEIVAFILGYICELELLTGERVEREAEETVVEALAGTQALRIVQELGFWAVEVEGDSLVVIMKLRATCIDRLEISNHKWEAKQVAHPLAKEGFCWKRDVWWVEDVPTRIQGLVEEEG